MTTPFTASIRQEANYSVIELSGEINAFVDQELSSVYQEAEAMSKAIIALDFSQVTFINSTGIALIVSLISRARKSGRTLYSFGLNEHFTQIFQITRLTEFIRPFPNEASLVSELRQA